MNRARITQAVLGINALVFLGLGAWFLINPEGVGVTGLPADTPSTRIELRATYGGFELGVGALLAWCVLGDAARRRVGLLAAALSIGGFGVGRVVGMLVEGGAESIHWTLLSVETVGVLASGLAFAFAPKEDAS